MVVKVYYNKDEDYFFSEVEREDMMKDLKSQMDAHPRDYREITDVLEDIPIDELWEFLSAEAKVKILDQAAEAYYSDTDWYASGEIEV